MTESSKSEEQSALALEGIDKRFGTTRALVSASLRVRAGTVHALLGENGAGKTTLMQVLFGMERADAVLTYDGQSRAAGERLKSIDAALAAAKTCPMLYQACHDIYPKRCTETLPPAAGH